jgi:hypothetical protein
MSTPPTLARVEPVHGPASDHLELALQILIRPPIDQA